MQKKEQGLEQHTLSKYMAVTLVVTRLLPTLCLKIDRQISSSFILKFIIAEGYSATVDCNGCD